MVAKGCGLGVDLGHLSEGFWLRHPAGDSAGIDVLLDGWMDEWPWYLLPFLFNI
jgi:hypothetical protein